MASKCVVSVLDWSYFH